MSDDVDGAACDIRAPPIRYGRLRLRCWRTTVPPPRIAPSNDAPALPRDEQKDIR